MVVGFTTIPTIFHAVDVVTLMPLDGLAWPVISHLPHATATATTGRAKPRCPEELLGPHTVVLQLGNDAGNPQVYFSHPYLYPCGGCVAVIAQTNIEEPSTCIGSKGGGGGQNHPERTSF